MKDLGPEGSGKWPYLMTTGWTFFFLNFYRASPMVYGGSQARGHIGAVAAGLHHSHSHSNARSQLRLRPTPQLMATPDP